MSCAMRKMFLVVMICTNNQLQRINLRLSLIFEPRLRIFDGVLRNRTL